MKSIAFFLMFLGFVALSMGSFLDDVFVAPGVNSALISCNATDSCAGKGDTCNGNYPGTGGCSRTNGTCCAFGLTCSVNKTCETDSYGDLCSSASDCFPGGSLIFACINRTCQYLLGVGDECTNNQYCYSGNCNTNTSMCQGIGAGGYCDPSQLVSSCNFGLTCQFNMNTLNTTCQNTTAPGATCNGLVPCYPGNVCFPKTFGNTSTCQAVGSQGEGMPCVADACQSGLVCGNSGTLLKPNMTCVTVNSSPVTCTNASSCAVGSLCYCSSVTGSSYCYGPTYNNPCTSESLSLTQCLADNQCQISSDAPDSCAQTKCSSEYKKSFSCGCSLTNSVLGKCAYNQFCGGFPVWAIIVIIVVAIVLVLAIVLLVFFMMRRRRQYDSI